MYKRNIDFFNFCKKMVSDIGNKTNKYYVEEILENIKDSSIELNLNNLRRIALNGASDWKQYSWCGCSLCYNYQIAELIFSKKIADNIEDEYRGKHLLDIQADFLRNSYFSIESVFNFYKKNCWGD